MQGALRGLQEVEPGLSASAADLRTRRIASREGAKGGLRRSGAMSPVDLDRAWLEATDLGRSRHDLARSPRSSARPLLWEPRLTNIRPRLCEPNHVAASLRTSLRRMCVLLVSLAGDFRLPSSPLVASNPCLPKTWRNQTRDACSLFDLLVLGLCGPRGPQQPALGASEDRLTRHT